MIPVIENNLQVGVSGDRVVMGIDQRPVAMFSPLEALMLASLLLKHAATIMAEPGRELVREAATKAFDGENGEAPKSPA